MVKMVMILNVNIRFFWVFFTMIMMMKMAMIVAKILMVTDGGLDYRNYETFCIVLQKMMVVRDNKGNDCRYRRVPRILIMMIKVDK